MDWGDFKVRDYYRKLVLEPLVVVDEPRNKKAWSIVWNSWMSSKVKRFSWRLFKDRLATRAHLVKRRIIENNNTCFCVFGFQRSEDRHHFFINCVIARRVWA